VQLPDHCWIAASGRCSGLFTAKPIRGKDDRENNGGLGKRPTRGPSTASSALRTAGNPSRVSRPYRHPTSPSTLQPHPYYRPARVLARPILSCAAQSPDPAGNMLSLLCAWLLWGRNPSGRWVSFRGRDVRKFEGARPAGLGMVTLICRALTWK